MVTILECLSHIARSGWFEKLYEDMLVGAGETAADRIDNPDQRLLDSAFEGVAMVVIEEAIHDDSLHTLDAPRNWAQRREKIKTCFKRLDDSDFAGLWVMVLDQLLTFTLPSSSGEPAGSMVTRDEAEDLVDAFVRSVSPEVAKRCCDSAEGGGYKCDQLKAFLAQKYNM